MVLPILSIGLLIGLLIFIAILAWAAWCVGASRNSSLAIFFLVIGLLAIITFALLLIFLI